MVGANDGIAFPMTDLLTTFNARGARSMACGLGFVPGGLAHWESALSIVSGNAGFPQFTAQDLIAIYTLI